MADLTFRARAHSENPTKTFVKVRNFEMVVDEPAELGGTNAGANPVEYLLAALSGCLNVVCHMVAQEMNFELRKLEIKLSGSLNPDKLFGKKSEDRAGYKQIEVVIKADTDADSDTLERWIKTDKERCPLSDTISQITPVDILLK